MDLGDLLAELIKMNNWKDDFEAELRAELVFFNLSCCGLACSGLIKEILGE